MINHSALYDKAIVADSRRQFARAVFDLYDPDMVVSSVTTNNENVYGKIVQTVERGGDETEEKIATLEEDRWKLDGTWNIAPDDPTQTKGQYGWWTETLSLEDGSFPEPYPYIEQVIENAEVLQGMTLQFSKKEWNVVPVDFVVEVYAGAQLEESKEFTGNTDEKVVYDGFVVNFPTKIKLIIKKIAKGNQRVRVIRFMAGFYEEWDGQIIKNIDILTESTFSGLSIPYSTCTIEVFNENKRFDPYAPNSLFRSIEERQAIVLDLGLRLEDGGTEWIPGGTYFQQSGGWSILPLTVQWNLLDIIGMLVNRRFVVPTTLPTTLEGWVQAIMASLGVNFRERYIVDTDIASKSVTATKDEVTDKFCGELLRFLCMATNTWPKQDFATGKLLISKIEFQEGNAITLDNMPDYAVMSENSAIADITFTLDKDIQGNAQEVTFPGTNTESDVSLSVNNPFVHTEEQAMIAFFSCMYEYGGKMFSVKSRGNPTSETGDIMSIQTQFNTEISARLKKQQIKIDQGVMRNLPSELVQSPNDSNYANKVVLTGSGTYTGPAGVTKIKITLIQGGTGGTGGGGGVMTGDGAYDDPTTGGEPGQGGKVYITEIDINDGQQISYNCGVGGTGGAGGAAYQNGVAGTDGGETTFGQFSSANGKRYSVGLMDVKTGAVYAAPGSRVNGLQGCGGLGGRFGENGYQYERTYEDEDGNSHSETVVARRPKAGERGAEGKPGCVIVEW